MAELADAHGSGPCGRPWGFESLRPHHIKNRSHWLRFFICTFLRGIRTREGASVNEKRQWRFEQRAVRRRPEREPRTQAANKESGRSNPFDRTINRKDILLDVFSAFLLAAN